MSRTLSKVSLPVPVSALVLVLVACGAGLRSPAHAEATTDAPDATSAHWQERKLDFTYAGFTSRYSCDGLQDQVKAILLHFGARKDVKVRATGCEYSASQVRPENFSRMAWVHAEFSALEPGPDANGASVPARWSKVLLTANRPYDMGMGECELVDAMRPVFEKGFSLRAVQYRTDCVPKHVSVGDYIVQAEALQPESLQASAH